MRILYQSIAARSLRNSSSLKFFILRALIILIARDITAKHTDGVHQIVITKSQVKDVTCIVNSDVINYGRCINSLSGRFIYQLRKPKRVV